MRKSMAALAAAVFACGLSAAEAGNSTLVLPDQQTPFGTLANPLTVQCSYNGAIVNCGGGSSGGYTGATATAPGTSGATATPVQGVANGVPLAVTWTGQTVGLTGALPAGTNTIGAVTQAGAPWSVGISGSLPAGTNALGSVSVSNFPTTQAVSGTVTANQGTPASTANAWPTTDTNAAQTITAPGTAAAKAQGIQGVSGGMAIAESLADGADTTLGSKADAANAATGSSAMAIFRQLHADLIAATPAGTAIIGKVGIDQTTPGVTNGVFVNNNTINTQAGYWNNGALFSEPASAAFSAFVVDKRAQLKISETGSDDPIVGITESIAGAGSIVAKSSAGNLYRAYATATTAPSAQQYLVCINATSVPASGATIGPVDFAPFNLATSAGSNASINFGPGPPSAYSTGITCVVSTSLTTYTPGTGSLVLNVAVR